MRSDESMNALKNDLLAHNWDTVYRETEVDCAHEAFLRLFKSLSDKFCPIIEYIKKMKYKECPWMSKGLINACKKKNALYRNFIKQKLKRQKLNRKNIKIS